MKSVTICLRLCLCSIILVSCAGYSATGGPGKLSNPSLISSKQSARDLISINSVAVMPITPALGSEGLSIEAIGANETLVTAMMDELDVRVFFDKNVASPNAANSADKARIAGKKLGADAILITKLSDYSERSGSKLGSDSPARVAFEMSMYRVSDDKQIWQASYSFKDGALSENLFSIDKKTESGKSLGFRSARDLLMEGFKTASRDFAHTRSAAFQGQ